MTKREDRFYRFLCKTFDQEYLIFPQMHLDSIVNYSGEEKHSWGAFQHINRKSVDYVLCDKLTLQPICAIELDDWTHTWRKRIQRDIEVERILAEARMPLIRIKNPDKVDYDRFIEYVSNAKVTRVSDQSF